MTVTDPASSVLARRSAERNTVPGLATAVREAAGMVIKRVRHESASRLTWSQGALLSELSRGVSTASELADSQGLRVQTVWASLEAMEHRELVVRERDPGDRRRVRVGLTDLGCQEFAADRELRDAWLVRVLTEDFSAEERGRLAGSLTLLTRLAGSELANRRTT